MCRIQIHPPFAAGLPAPEAGDFFADARHALELRDEVEDRFLEGIERVELDFSNVRNTSQSWMNAFIGNLALIYGHELSKKVIFKNCNDTMKSLVRYVYSDALARREQDPVPGH